SGEGVGGHEVFAAGGRWGEAGGRVRVQPTAPIRVTDGRGSFARRNPRTGQTATALIIPPPSQEKSPSARGSAYGPEKYEVCCGGAKKFQPAQWANCIIRVGGWGYQIPAPGRQELPTLAKSLQNLGR